MVRNETWKDTDGNTPDTVANAWTQRKVLPGDSIGGRDTDPVRHLLFFGGYNCPPESSRRRGRGSAVQPRDHVWRRDGRPAGLRGICQVGPEGRRTGAV